MKTMRRRPGSLVVRSVSWGLVAVTLPAASVSAALIGVDAIHGFDEDSVLGTGASFDAFRSTITDLGHTIVPLTSFGQDDLAGLDAVVLMTPYLQNDADYTGSELSSIHGFAERAVFVSDASMWIDPGIGGDRPITFGDNRRLLENAIGYAAAGRGILVVGENGGGFDVANLNELASPFGVEFAAEATERDGHDISGFVDHPVTSGLGTIGVDFQLRLTVTDPALDLTLGAGADDALATWALPAPGVLTLLGMAVLGTGSRRRRRS